MALSSTGLSRTCHLAATVSDLITLSSPSIPPAVVFPKAPFSVLCFSPCTLPPQYSHLLPFPEPSPLCRRHPTLSLILPANFDSIITHLQNALQQISSWMTAKLLTLNSSKTEFVLIGLKK